MKVLKATKAQYDNLNGFQNGNSVLLFVKDANDNWIVGKNVVNDKAFSAIKNDLLQLQEIDYNPKPSKI